MEQAKKIILGISGSLRERSSNAKLLEAIGMLMPADAEFRLYEGIGRLPHFNPDLDGDDAEPPKTVREWREQLGAADGIVICTPEYARGVPGSLKNALDWAVSSGEFVNKPTAAVSGSPHPDGGSVALSSIVATLRMMSAVVPDEATLAVSFLNKKLGPDGKVTDADTRASLEKLVRQLTEARGADA